MQTPATLPINTGRKGKCKMTRPQWRMSKIERKEKEIREIKSALWETQDPVIRHNLERVLDNAYEELEALEKEAIV